MNTIATYFVMAKKLDWLFMFVPNGFPLLIFKNNLFTSNVAVFTLLVVCLG